MLRRLWFWLVGESPAQKELRDTLRLVVEQQRQTTLAIMNAVDSVVAASREQAAVLQSYLKLFQNSGEPERWEAMPEADTMNALVTQGFPKEGTEPEQAQWILNHLTSL